MLESFGPSLDWDIETKLSFGDRGDKSKLNPSNLNTFFIPSENYSDRGNQTWGKIEKLDGVGPVDTRPSMG